MMSQRIGRKGTVFYEKALADFYCDICILVCDIRLGWHRDFPTSSSDSARGCDDGRPSADRGRRDLQRAKRLAGNGRNGERLDLGTWLLRCARLVSGLSTSRGTLHLKRMVEQGFFKRLR